MTRLCFLGLSFAITVVAASLDMAKVGAAEVNIAVSQQETYLGYPIQLQIQIDNATKHDPPVIADVDGLKIEPFGNPSRSSQLMIVNGRATRTESIVYGYLVTPLREGNFTIPPIPVTADGIKTITKAVGIVVSKSETGDLLLVEVDSDQDEVFVGEPITLSLKVFVRPFRDPKTKRPLSEARMWQLFSEQTQWGVFTESLEELRMQRSQPRGRSVLRQDSEGESHEYILYKVQATLYPDRPGPISMDDIRVVMNYPTAMRDRRSPFGASSPFQQLFEDDFPTLGPSLGSLLDDSRFPGFGSRSRIASVRPISADAQVEPIIVKPVPTDGQPETYGGAVGRYMIGTKATPTEVKVGDPITLRIGIRGNGPMSLVQPPPLSKLPELTSDFRVEDRSLGGLVDGDQKLFTTTIRPKNDSVTQIPAIPLTFFNPETETFETVYSDPIQIEVTPAEMLAIDTPAPLISRGSTQQNGQPESLASQASTGTGSTDIFDDAHTESSNPLAQQTVKSFLPRWLLAIIVVPPLIFIGSVISRFILAWRSRRITAPLARKQIASADHAEPIKQIVEKFVRDRYNLRATDSPGTSVEALVGQLRSSGKTETAILVERFFQVHRDAAHETPETISPLRESASALIDDVEDLATKPAWNRRGRAGSRRGAELATSFLIAAWLVAPESAYADLQNQLDAGLSAYAQGKASTTTDEAQRNFENAAAQFQSLTDTGIQNADLQFQLGNAYFKANEPARAIAAYLRARRIAPDEPAFARNLIAARDSLRGPTANPTRDTVTLLASRVPFLPNLVVTSATWLIFWTCLIWWLVAPTGSSTSKLTKRIAAIAILITALGGGLYFLQTEPLRLDSHAVVITPAMELRQGDDLSFPVVTNLRTAEGQVVRWVNRRSGWTQVQLPDGERGWVEDRDLDFI